MTNLIPDFCVSNSPGEPILFEYFEKDSLLDNVTILHSLNIADHVRLPESEADFVCLIPNMGILVIEVKGHQTIGFKDGFWTMGKDKPTTRGPLQQAKEAMYSIRKFLDRNGVPVSKIPMFYVAWFPNTSFETPSTVEWESWQYLSHTHNEKSGKWVLDTMASAIRHLENKLGSSLKPEEFDDALLSTVAKLLRPNFECQLSEKDLRSTRRQELIRFAEDQFQALDMMRENSRYVVTGPAGTGKTLLALEQARRMRIAGLNPIVLCFNKNLSALLSKENSDLSVMTISKLISEIAIENGKRPDDILDLNTIEITGPQQFESIRQYDSLVIDEAQDVFSERYIEWLDKVIKGGLSEGIWSAFGDFDSQRIYGQNDGRLLVETKSNFAKGYLGTNCRNTELIGSYTTQIVPSAPKWASFRRRINQVEPRIKFPSNEDSLGNLIDEAVNYFRAEKFSFDDIVVLSPNKILDPGVDFQESEFASKFIQYATNSVGKIRFSTIHGFKGLESPCVLLIELYNLANMPDKESLKYVALTRATDRLFIVNDKKTDKVMQEYLNV
jgi:hypothetical protein